MLPNFGTKDANVKCKIVCVQDKIPAGNQYPGRKVDTKNCMECEAWLTSEIERFNHLSNPTELWSGNQ